MGRSGKSVEGRGAVRSDVSIQAVVQKVMPDDDGKFVVILSDTDNNVCRALFSKARYVIIRYKEKGDMSRGLLGHGHRGGRETRVPIGEKRGPNEFREKGRFCTILFVNFVLIFKKTIANITNLSKYEDIVVDWFRNSGDYFCNKNLLSAVLGSAFVLAVVSGFSYHHHLT